MKNMKKLASLLLTLIIAFSLTTTVFADGETGKITINNATIDDTYIIYEILKLESYNTTSKAYSYKVTDTWSSFINSGDINGTYVNVDSQGYVTWVNGADVAAFATKAIAYAKSIEGFANNGEQKATSTTITFDNLELGYYLVDSTLGTLCNLTTTNPTATIQDKNVKPTIEKQVQEDSTGSWGSTNDSEIGQTVNFKTTVHAKKGASNYVVHDKMSEGLTFNDVTSVTASSVNNGTKTLTRDTDYEVLTQRLGGDCTFHVTFKQNYLNSITEDTDIVIEYNANLNEKAVIAGAGNTNVTRLSYGDSSQTEESTTITYAWEIPIFKYTGNEKTPLADAKFVLYKIVDSVNKYAKIDNGKITGWVNDKASSTELITNAGGTVSVAGLDADTYYLEEVKAPDGYNKLSAPVKVTITRTIVDGQNEIKFTQDDTETERVEIRNNTGMELPTTGGIGTTIFYVVGSILVLVAVVLLITKKRMSTKD